MARTPAGEDLIVSCAELRLRGEPRESDFAISWRSQTKPGPDAPEEFPTPGVRTIEDLIDVSRRRGSITTDQVAGFLRHDRRRTTSGAGLTARRSSTARNQTGRQPARDCRAPGASGRDSRPARRQRRQSRRRRRKSESTCGKVDLRIVADSALKNRRNMTTGANKDDHHLRGVDIARDIPVDEWFELRTVESGEGCPRCETGVLEVFKGMEIGHIFKLGTKYSESMGATVLNAGRQRSSDRDGQLWHRRGTNHQPPPSNNTTTTTGSSGRNRSRRLTWSSRSQT